MIKIEHLTKTYGDFVALKDLNLEIPDGQFTVLLGPSGAGKTTVLRMLNRMVAPTSGRILLDSVDIAEGKPEDLRRRMGYVIQNTGLFPNMNVRRNVGTVPRLLGWDKKKTAERVDEMLDLVGLDPDAYGPKLPSQLSGGEAQRVGVARSLAADPPIILMDEPFGAVDPITRSHLQLELKSLHRRLKKTIVLVTHDIDEAVLLAEKIALFRNGTLQQYATAEQLWKHPANGFVRDFFGDDLGIRLMQRHTLSELDLCAAEPSNASCGLPEIERSATFRDALAALIDSENGEVSVVENGVPVGIATFDLLTAALEKGAS